MYRWHAPRTPQHMLPGSAACALGTTSFVSIRDERTSKPAHREAP